MKAASAALKSYKNVCLAAYASFHGTAPRLRFSSPRPLALCLPITAETHAHKENPA